MHGSAKPGWTWEVFREYPLSYIPGRYHFLSSSSSAGDDGEYAGDVGLYAGDEGL